VDFVYTFFEKMQSSSGHHKNSENNVRMGNWMKRSLQSGFTLLEVMIAVSIIAIAFVTLIGSQSQSVSIAGHTRFVITSALLAQKKLTDIESADFGYVSSGSGDFGENYPGYSWKTDVSELSEDDTGIEGSDGMLKAVNLIVTFGNDEGQAYAVRTIVMQKPTN
jgi:general secretion pathway protein I